MAPLAIAKLVGGVAAIVVIGGILWTVRDSLIDKGMNIVYAQNNAAILKAQADQTSKDKATLDQQRKYIERLELSGVQIKETVRETQAPCKGDGVGDPRLDAVGDWVRDALSSGPGSTQGGPPTKGTVPSTGAPAGKR